MDDPFHRRMGEVPDRIDGWEPRLRELIPSYGEKLNPQPEVAEERLSETAATLALTA